MLWLIVVLGILAAVSEDSGFLSVVRWVPRVITTGSVISAVVAPSWAFMTVAESGRSTLGLGRLVGLTSHPNSLAQFATLGIAFELFGPKPSGLRLVWVSSAVTCAVLSQSTTSLFASGLLLGVWLLSVRGHARIGFIAAFFIVALGWLALIEANAISSIFSTDRFQTVSGRHIIWQFSWASITEHPIIGLGTAFLSEEFRQMNLPADQQQAIHAHNQLIQTLGESGFLGGGFLVVAFAGLFLHAIRQAAVSGMGLLATWLAVIVMSYTEVLIRPAGPTGVIGLLIFAFLSHTPSRDEPGLHIGRKGDALALTQISGHSSRGWRA